MNPTLMAGYVLIADDDVDDIDILTTALKEANQKLEVLVAKDGRSVMEQLKQKHPSGVPPCVLVMDLNMPKMDGRETVVAIKNDAGLKDMPILLFSTAKNKTDELFAQKWGVHFFQKPDTVQGLNEIAHIILRMCNERENQTTDVQRDA